MSDHQYALAKAKPVSVKKGHKCVVCGNAKQSWLQFHTVPTDTEKHKIWESAVKFKLSVHARICSDHFVNDDYIPSRGTGACRKLKKNAVPSENLDSQEAINSDSALSSKPKDLTSEECKALAELENLLDSEKVSEQEWSMLRKDANDILDLIRSVKFKENLLLKIGESHLEDKWNGALGPFTLFSDLTQELFNSVQDYGENICTIDQLWGGFLSEVILLSIEKVKNVNRDAAYKYFKRTSSLHGLQ